MTAPDPLENLWPDARARAVYRHYAWTLMRAVIDYFGVGEQDGSVLFDLDDRGNAARVLSADFHQRQQIRAQGLDWPLRNAASMSGLKRLENFQFCLEQVVADRVPGDVIETGVWRGGACVFARAILDALGEQDRLVWLADSFAGLPPPDGRYEADNSSTLHDIPELRVSVDQVKAQFDRFGVRGEGARFLKGWFADTLMTSAPGPFAIARLDGDMYASTMDALEGLYHKVSPGGFVIIDDYGAVPACRQAVEDFRTRLNISAPIQTIDWTGVYWRVA